MTDHATAARIIDEQLIAKARADRKRATDPSKAAAMDRVIEMLSEHKGESVEQVTAEIHARARAAEAERDRAMAKRDKTEAVLLAAEGGFTALDAPVGGSYNLKSAVAQPGRAYAATAAQVISSHARLHDLLASPPRVTMGLVRWFAEAYADKPDADPMSRYMFWPYYVGGQRPKQDWERKLLGAIGRGLFTATTYQVTAEMCDIAEAMYEQTATTNGQVEASDLPSECGFLWLDKPFVRSDATGDSYYARVITWAPQSVRRDGDVLPGVRVTVWSDWEPLPGVADSRRLENWSANGPLLMAMTCVVPFGSSFDGLHDDQVPAVLHYVHAVWLLLGTEVAVVERTSVPRQVRKRAQATIRQHEVRVVTLRRAIHQVDPDGREHRDIDWSCRWLVRGFWRHRWGYGTVGRFHEGQGDGGDPPHCLACGARVTWVRPHVKGPDDRPLKAVEKVYRLSR